MKIFCDGNLSIDGVEYENVNGACEVPDSANVAELLAHGCSLEEPKPAKAKRQQVAENVA